MRHDNLKRVFVLAAAALLAVLPATPLLAEPDEQPLATDFDQYFEQEKPSWTFIPAGHGGQNKLGSNYDGYEDLGAGGFDVYFNPPLPEFEEPDWRHKLMFRLSGDYFPLQVPEGVYGLTEDIYSLNCGIVKKFMHFRKPEGRQWTPFLAGGFGVYWDRITLDTPASGKVTGMHTYFGFNGGAGLMFPSILGLRLVPEFRWHGMRPAGNVWVTNTVYQGSVMLWFGRKSERQ
jgi:hypothetical protein